MESNQSSSSVNSNKTTKLRKTLKSENLGGSSNQVEYNIEKRMKKDDSGISIEKSPSDSSDEEITDVATQEMEKEVPTTDNKKTGEFSGLNSPDSGNQDCCSLNDFPENSASFDTISEIQSVTPSTEQVGDTEAQVKKSQNGISESKNSSEKNFNSGGEDMSIQSEDISIQNKTKSEDETNYDPTPDAPKPKHKWAASKEALNRQYGTSVRYSPDFFRYNCYGSLHMVERLELMYKMKKHDGCVNALNFNSSGTKLATGSDDLGIIIWDWTISEPILEYSSGHRSNVFQAKFMPLSGDCQVVSCARDGQVRIAELSTTGICKSTRKLAQHRGAAHKLAVQMDSPHTFLSCGEDAAVFEIDLRENKPEKLVICKENEKKIPLYSIFINPCNSYEYTTGGRDHYVRVYDKRCIRQEDGFLKKYCPEHLVSSDIRANVTCVVYNYSGEEILASFNDEDIYIFDARTTDTAQYLHRYKGHRNSQTVKGVNYFGPKSEYIISGSDCGYIFFWEKESEHIVKYMHGDEGGVVNCLEPNPNLPVLATSGLDDDIKIWVPSCEELPDLSGLRNHIISNMKEREEERKQDGPETFDDHMLWFLMQHLRRARRRAQSGSREAENSSSSSTDSESHDDETEFHHAIQCSQS